VPFRAGKDAATGALMGNAAPAGHMEGMSSPQTSPAPTLAHLPAHAASYIQRVGWVQDTDEETEQATDGRVNLDGALRSCTPVVGDGFIAREVLRRQGHAEDWDYADGRTQDEVVAYLAASEITDDDLAATFGPQWPEIIVMVRRAANFTRDELVTMHALQYDRSAGWTGVALIAYDTSRSGWDAVWSAVWDASCSAAGTAIGDAHRSAAVDAALALLVRDLIGRHNFTQEQYNEMTRQWRTVIDPLHPDDDTGPT